MGALKFDGHMGIVKKQPYSYSHHMILLDMKTVSLSSKNIVCKMFLYSFTLIAEKASRIHKAITAI